MSPNVLDQVWTAEMAFLRDMYLLDADFFRFVWGLLQQPEAAAPATAALAVHAGTKVCVRTCSKRAFGVRLRLPPCVSRACYYCNICGSDTFAMCPPRYGSPQ